MSETPAVDGSTGPEGPVETEEPHAPRGLRGYIPFLVCLALLAVAILAFQLIGASSHTFVAGHDSRTVESSRDGFLLLKDLGVKGRVLVLFDKTSHVKQWMSYEYARAVGSPPASTPVTPEDYVAGLIGAGIAREVYVVVPESEWRSSIETGPARGDFISENRRLVARLFGAPVIYVTPKTLPRFDEKVITYVPSAVATEYPSGFLASFDNPAVSDVYITQKGR